MAWTTWFGQIKAWCGNHQGVALSAGLATVATAPLTAAGGCSEVVGLFQGTDRPTLQATTRARPSTTPTP